MSEYPYQDKLVDCNPDMGHYSKYISYFNLLLRECTIVVHHSLEMEPCLRLFKINCSAIKCFFMASVMPKGMRGGGGGGQVWVWWDEHVQGSYLPFYKTFYCQIHLWLLPHSHLHPLGAQH